MATANYSFEELMARDCPVILDGGLATELESRGYDLSNPLWSAELLLHHPQAIIDVHRAYFDAGANCAISASYQATQQGFMALGLGAIEAKELIIKSVQLAIVARDDFLRANKNTELIPLVAASVGPYGASLADGSEYTGDYAITDKTLMEFHQQRLGWLDNSDADVLACETIPSKQEARVLCELLRSVSTPAWISFSCRDGKHLNDGTPIQECAAMFIDHLKVLALGSNCTSPLYISSLISEIKHAAPNKAIVVYPNSGEQYDAASNSWHGTSSPLECGAAARTWRAKGADIIGGCCRMGPAHIKEISRHLSRVEN
jgi:homocysteine S-methyltransferase